MAETQEKFQQTQIELNETEQVLRAVSLAYPSLLQRTGIPAQEIPALSAQTGLDFDRLTAVPFSEDLSEDDFFGTDVNTALFRHLRYLPPVLHRHRFFELAYVVSGSCCNRIDSEEILMREGDVCIIAPDSEHALSAFSDNALIYNVLIRASTFESAFFGTLSERDVLSAFFSHALYAGQRTPHILFRTGEDMQLRQLFHQLVKENEKEQKYKRRLMDNLITAFFILLLRRHEQDIVLSEDRHLPQDDNLLYLLNYIQANYAHLTIGEVADFFHYSERQIARLVKDHTGMTFTDLIRQLRLHRAAELLANPDLPVHAVMEAVGYTDLSSFYKTFRNYYGVTPARYRQNLQQ